MKSQGVFKWILSGHPCAYNAVGMGGRWIKLTFLSLIYLSDMAFSDW